DRAAAVHVVMVASRAQSSAPPAPVVRAESALPKEPEPPEPPEQQAAAPEPAAAPRSEASVARAGGDEEFIDAKRLSVRPAPVDDIRLPDPAPGEVKSAAKATLTVFIDDLGRVMHVRVDDSNLPPSIEAAVRRAFAEARFRPGMLGGRAVKSRWPVEVLIDAL